MNLKETSKLFDEFLSQREDLVKPNKYLKKFVKNVLKNKPQPDLDYGLFQSTTWDKLDALLLSDQRIRVELLNISKNNQEICFLLLDYYVYKIKENNENEKISSEYKEKFAAIYEYSVEHFPNYIPIFFIFNKLNKDRQVNILPLIEKLQDQGPRKSQYTIKYYLDQYKKEKKEEKKEKKEKNEENLKKALLLSSQTGGDTIYPELFFKLARLSYGLDKYENLQNSVKYMKRYLSCVKLSTGSYCYYFIGKVFNKIYQSSKELPDLFSSIYWYEKANEGNEAFVSGNMMLIKHYNLLLGKFPLSPDERKEILEKLAFCQYVTGDADEYVIALFNLLKEFDDWNNMLKPLRKTILAFNNFEIFNMEKIKLIHGVNFVKYYIAFIQKTLRPGVGVGSGVGRSN